MHILYVDLPTTLQILVQIQFLPDRYTIFAKSMLILGGQLFRNNTEEKTMKIIRKIYHVQDIKFKLMIQIKRSNKKMEISRLLTRLNA